jgi:hypothetical protein
VFTNENVYLNTFKFLYSFPVADDVTIINSQDKPKMSGNKFFVLYLLNYFNALPVVDVMTIVMRHRQINCS